MQIKQELGSFEILSRTEDIISAIAIPARVCYQSTDKASPENDRTLLHSLIARGHHAMLEFADMTVRFDGCSRALANEFVRHRLASYAQESTRYVREVSISVIEPPHRELGPNINTLMQASEDAYKECLKEGWKPEDARQNLPLGIESQFVVKANMREWRHIFQVRCAKNAHWEIRSVLLKLLKHCKKSIPIIFDDYHIDEDAAVLVLAPGTLAKYISDYAKYANVSELILTLPQNVKKLIKDTL